MLAHAHPIGVGVLFHPPPQPNGMTREQAQLAEGRRVKVFGRMTNRSRSGATGVFKVTSHYGWLAGWVKHDDGDRRLHLLNEEPWAFETEAEDAVAAPADGGTPNPRVRAVAADDRPQRL